MGIATQKVVTPGSVGLTKTHPLKQSAMGKRPSAGLGPVTAHPAHSGVGAQYLTKPNCRRHYCRDYGCSRSCVLDVLLCHGVAAVNNMLSRLIQQALACKRLEQEGEPTPPPGSVQKAVVPP